jgi:uncharacterized membrane protein YhdT
VVLHLETRIIHFQTVMIHISIILVFPLTVHIYLEKVLIVGVMHIPRFRHITCLIMVILFPQIHGIELRL